MRRRLRLRHLPCLCRAGMGEKLPKASPMESDMLDFAIDPRPTSRLSCQISLTPELDGIVIETPLRQG